MRREYDKTKEISLQGLRYMAVNSEYRHSLLGILLVGLFFCLLALSSCAVNPASKKVEFMVVSEEQEFRIGQKVDKQVREQMGVYLELPNLRSLVKEVGGNIGRNSDRPNLIYRIEIVDLPDYNAFAIPGGFVYVHRGLVERMNSVDELASVLSHEIAHVAARHSAAQISKAQLINIGLLGVTIATEGAGQSYSPLIDIGATLAFTKFSRDDEREADHFGTRYMVRAGYNPKASIDVMNQIQRLQVREPTSLETWFMTHPPTSERLANLHHEVQQIRLEQPEVLKRTMNRNRYVALLNGLAVGEWNGNELIKGDRYYNKEFLLSIRIPEGWHGVINNKNYTAIFFHPKRNFYGFFNIEPLRIRKSTPEYFASFERQLLNLGLRKVTGLSGDRVLNHGALIALYEGYAQGMGDILAEGIAFVKGAHGYSLLGFSKKGDFSEFRPQIESMIGRLQFITRKEASQLQPPRLRIHEVVEGETWASVTQKYFHSSREMKKLAEYNGFEVSGEPTAGILLKIPPSLRF